MDILVKMSDGNPGAMGCISEILINAANIDPDNFAGPFGPLLSLDMYNIYGTDLYKFYNDCCHKNLVMVIAVLRATQLGKYSVKELKDMIHGDGGRGFDMSTKATELYSLVQDQLPRFNGGKPLFQVAKEVIPSHSHSAVKTPEGVVVEDSAMIVETPEGTVVDTQ
jgi:hypothetical protein